MARIRRVLIGLIAVVIGLVIFSTSTTARVVQLAPHTAGASRYDVVANYASAHPVVEQELSRARTQPETRASPSTGPRSALAASVVAAEGATSAAGGSVTQLFRITDEAETTDILSSEPAAYRTLPTQEGKYFFPTAEQGTNAAEMFGTMPSTAGQYSLTSGFVPTKLLDQFVFITNAGEGPGYFVPEEFLSRFFNVQVHGPVP